MFKKKYLLLKFFQKADQHKTLQQTRMNANSYNVEILVERSQVEEAVLGIFHTILLHRTTGKFHYHTEKERFYSVGTVGTDDVDCEFLNFTYVRVASKVLDSMIRKQIVDFCEQLQQKTNNNLSMGTITLEFYQKRRSRWPFNDECVPWEIWNIQVTERVLATESERNIVKETTGSKLGDKVISVVEAVGRHDFVPKMPAQADLPLVFETSLLDVQPYLFKIYFNFGNIGFSHTGSNKASSVGSTVRKIFRNTLTL
ncbi:autophagy-related protein 101-like [Clavelina lepadiformis]|uniref:Autophagy-related protein 101 n=1 Tax=Clavelina lepadiformis TaxID=159417 RepID=A0ABP0GEJ6_CLALP